MKNEGLKGTASRRSGGFARKLLAVLMAACLCLQASPAVLAAEEGETPAPAVTETDTGSNEGGGTGEGTPGEGTPGEGTPGEGTPGEGAPGEGTPGEGTPGEGTPGEGTPGEGTPGEGTPGEGAPGEGTPGEGTPGEGTPGEDLPGEGEEPPKIMGRAAANENDIMPLGIDGRRHDVSVGETVTYTVLPTADVDTLALGQMTTQDVNPGQKATNSTSVTVNDKGKLCVYQGGVVTGAVTINSGGTLEMRNHGTVNGTITVQSGGTVFIWTGGAALTYQVYSGANVNYEVIAPVTATTTLSVQGLGANYPGHKLFAALKNTDYHADTFKDMKTDEQAADYVEQNIAKFAVTGADGYQFYRRKFNAKTINSYSAPTPIIGDASNEFWLAPGFKTTSWQGVPTSGAISIRLTDKSGKTYWGAMYDGRAVFENGLPDGDYTYTYVGTDGKTYTGTLTVSGGGVSGSPSTPRQVAKLTVTGMTSGEVWTVNSTTGSASGPYTVTNGVAEIPMKDASLSCTIVADGTGASGAVSAVQSNVTLNAGGTATVTPTPGKLVVVSGVSGNKLTGALDASGAAASGAQVAQAGSTAYVAGVSATGAAYVGNNAGYAELSKGTSAAFQKGTLLGGTTKKPDGSALGNVLITLDGSKKKITSGADGKFVIGAVQDKDLVGNKVPYIATSDAGDHGYTARDELEASGGVQLGRDITLQEGNIAKGSISGFVSNPEIKLYDKATGEEVPLLTGGAVTFGEGTYTITGVPAGDLVLVATGSDGSAVLDLGTIGKGTINEGKNVTAVAGAKVAIGKVNPAKSSLAVDVYDPAKIPTKETTQQVVDEGSGAYFTTVPGGKKPAVITVTTGTGKGVSSGMAEVDTSDPNKALIPVPEIATGEGSLVIGKVDKDTEGGKTVTIPGDPKDKTTTTYPGGGFIFPSVSPGRHVIMIEDEGEPGSSAAALVDVPQTDPSGGGSLTLTPTPGKLATGTAPKDLVGATITVYDKDGDPVNDGGTVVTGEVDSEGRFALPGVTGAGPYTVTLSKDGPKSAVVTVQEGGDLKKIEIPAEAVKDGALVVGKVSGLTGSDPLAGAVGVYDPATGKKKETAVKTAGSTYFASGVAEGDAVGVAFNTDNESGILFPDISDGGKDSTGAVSGDIEVKTGPTIAGSVNPATQGMTVTVRDNENATDGGDRVKDSENLEQDATATTDAKGQFVFKAAGMAPNSDMTVFAAGSGKAGVGQVTWGVPLLGFANPQVETGTLLNGKVEDEASKPVVGGTVEIVDKDGNHLLDATTVKNGFYDVVVPSGTDLTGAIAQVSDPDGNRSGAANLTAEGEGSLTAETLTIQPGSTVLGAVTVPDGVTVEAGGVAVYDRGGKKIPGATAAYDPATKKYVISGVAPTVDNGDYTVVVSGKEDGSGNLYTGTVTFPVTPGSVTAGKDVKLAKGALLQGVTDPGATVSVKVPGVEDPLTVTADKEGNYYIPGVPEGELVVTVTTGDPAKTGAAKVTVPAEAAIGDSPVTPVEVTKITPEPGVLVTGKLTGETIDPTTGTVWINVPDGKGGFTKKEGLIDGEGSYYIPGVEPGKYPVMVSDGPDGDGNLVTGVTAPVTVGTTSPVTGDPITAVTGSMLFGVVKPAKEGVEIQLKDKDGKPVSTTPDKITTGGGGQYAVPGLDPEKGPYTLVATDPDPRNPKTGVLPLVEVEKGKVTDLTGDPTRTVGLLDGCLVSGKVTDGGTPVPGVPVGMTVLTGKEDNEPAARDFVTDEGGNYFIPGVNNYVYWISAVTGEGTPDVRSGAKRIEVDGKDLDNVVIELVPGALASGKITVSGGKALPDATVEVMVPDGNGGFETKTATTDNMGNYVLTGLPDGGPYTVAVYGTDPEDGRGFSGAGSLTVTNGRVDKEKSLPSVVAEPGALITGTLTDETGAPIVGGKATVTIPTEGGFKTVTATTDGSGRYYIPGAGAGDYEIAVTTPDGKGRVDKVTASDGKKAEADAKGDLKPENLPMATGVAADPAGKPIAGAAVTIRNKNDLSAPVTDKSGSEITGITTGEGGGYVLPGLPDGAYIITTTSKDGQSGLTEITVSGGKVTGSKGVPNRTGVQVTGAITSDGTPVKGATVSVTIPTKDLGGNVIGSKTLTVTTGAQGEYVLVGVPEGTYDLVVTSGGKTVTQKLTVEATDLSGKDIDLKDAKATLTGVVKDKDAKPLEGASVSLLDPKTGATVEVDANGNLTTDGDPLTVQTGAGGEYVLSGVPDGKYVVYARGGDKAGVTQELTVSGGKVTGVTNVTALDGTALFGVVKDGETPVPGATVLLKDKDGNELGTTTTNSDGRYFLSGMTDNCTIVAVKDGKTKSHNVASIVPGGLAWKDLVLEAPASTVISVTGPDGKPLSGAEVTFLDQDGEEVKGVSLTTDTTGQVDLKTSGLAAGSYTAVVKKDGLEKRSPVTLGEGQAVTAGALVNVTPTTVTGQVRFENGGVPKDTTVTIKGPKGTVWGEARLDANGGFTLAGVPDGEYTFVAAVSGGQTVTGALKVQDGKLVDGAGNPAKGPSFNDPSKATTDESGKVLLTKPEGVKKVDEEVAGLIAAIAQNEDGKPNTEQKQKIIAAKQAYDKLDPVEKEQLAAVGNTVAGGDPLAKDIEQQVSALVGMLVTVSGEVDAELAGVPVSSDITEEEKAALLVEQKELSEAAKADQAVDVTLTMKVEDKTDFEPYGALVGAAVERYRAENAQVGAYFDITIDKTVRVDTLKGAAIVDSTVSMEPVKELPSARWITLGIPSAIQGYEYYYIYRVHDNKVQMLNTTYNKSAQTLTFASDLFSVYAVVHSDAKLPTGGSGHSGGGSGGGGSSRPDSGDFWRTVERNIQKAGAGDTVKANAKWDDKMPRYVMDALRENGGVSLVITWNGGKKITIPAGMAQPFEKLRVYYPLSLLAKLYDGAELSDAQPVVAKGDKRNPATGGVWEVTAPASADVQPSVVAAAPNEGLAAAEQEAGELMEQLGFSAPASARAAGSARVPVLPLALAGASLLVLLLAFVVWRRRRAE